MRLIDLIHEELIDPDLQGSTRDEVIAALVDRLVGQGALPAERREAALEAIQRREASQTTGLGGGVAIPHGLCAGVEELVGALGIHRAGVDFQALDGAPVRLVIVLVVPQNKFQAHIRTLAGIARVLNDRRLREEIAAAPDAATIMDILVAQEEAAV